MYADDQKDLAAQADDVRRHVRTILLRLVSLERARPSGRRRTVSAGHYG